MKLDSYWTDYRARLRAARGASCRRRPTWRSSAAASPACRRRWRWPGAAPSVVVLEAGERVAAEASGRNGGHVNNGLAVDYAEVAAKVGVERGARLVPRLSTPRSTRSSASCATKAIDCDFVRHGKLKLATRPAQLDALSRSAERLVGRRCRHRRRDPATRRACAPRWRATASTAACSTSAAARCTWAASRTAWRRRPSAAARRSTPARCVQRLERLAAGGQAHRVHTARGTVDARSRCCWRPARPRHGGYGSFGWLRRRIVPIGSFIVVTEPLGAERAAGAAARAPHLRDGRRTSTTTSASRRTTGWCSAGARASRCRVPRRTRRAARSCAPAWSRPSRQLAGVGIDYCWGGLVDMTQDRLPHAGERDGLFYSMGYSGHGTQMSVLHGRAHGRRDGRRCRPPTRGAAATGPRFPATSARRGSCPRWACTTA